MQPLHFPRRSSATFFYSSRRFPLFFDARLYLSASPPSASPNPHFYAPFALLSSRLAALHFAFFISRTVTEAVVTRRGLFYCLRGSHECVQQICNYCKLLPQRERGFPAHKFRTRRMRARDRIFIHDKCANREWKEYSDPIDRPGRRPIGANVIARKELSRR